MSNPPLRRIGNKTFILSAAKDLRACSKNDMECRCEEQSDEAIPLRLPRPAKAGLAMTLSRHFYPDPPAGGEGSLKMSYEPQNQDWSFVEHALEEGACSGFKIAILESEKIFQQMVKNCHFKRPVVIKELPKILSEPEKFFHARLIAEKIILEPSFEITREDAKNIIAAYWRGVQDFGDWLEGVGWLEKQFLKIKYYFPKKAFAKAGIFLFLLILFIQLTNKTQVGGNAIAFIADWNDFLFWKIIIAVGVGAVAVIGYKISKIYINK